MDYSRFCIDLEGCCVGVEPYGYLRGDGLLFGMLK